MPAPSRVSFIVKQILSVFTLLILSLITTLQTSYAASDVLTITGKVENGAQSFSFKELEQLPRLKIVTETIWTDEPHTYTAISVKQLLTSVSAQGSTLKLIALNDYSVEVPINTLVEHDAFIAYEQDGKRMRIRDKGPLWILYPFSDKPEINIPVYQSHSVWQLKSIEVF